MKNIVISMPMDEKAQNAIIAKLSKIDWLKEANLEFVHVFKEESYPYMAPPILYPDQEQKIEIRKTIKEIFDGLISDFPDRKSVV